MESGDWAQVSGLPLVASSRDFVAMKLQLEAMRAAQRGDVTAAKAAAEQIAVLSSQSGRRPLAQKIMAIQAKEAAARAAQADRNFDDAMASMNQAAAIEDSIYALSQPPYPPIPAHEMYGNMLMEINRPAEAEKQYTEALERTPGRPKAIYGIARAAAALGDSKTAAKRYTQFLSAWRDADQDLPETGLAKRFLASVRSKP